MLVVALVMLVIIAIAALVVAFVAFPHRGEELPAAPWLGEAMSRAAGAMPTIDGDHAEHGPTRRGDAGVLP
jgi:hypothetical protein